MKDVVSLDQFRKPKPEKALKANPSLKHAADSMVQSPPINTTNQQEEATQPAVKLNKAARDFRERFLAALATLKNQANREIELASQQSEVKTRINVSSVLKLAKSSPLTVYSPLHRETLIPMVEAAARELDAALTTKFAPDTSKRKQTIASLEQELKETKATFENQLARLASQKLAEHVAQRDSD